MNHELSLPAVPISLHCFCGAVKLEVTGTPILQYVCHCDDCQAVHGKAFSVSLHPARAIHVIDGETELFTLKTSPRTRCKRCETHLFAESVGHPVRGLNGELLPAGLFKPEFHIQCRYATSRIEDTLPHYCGIPSRFGGSDEIMEW